MYVHVSFFILFDWTKYMRLRRFYWSKEGGQNDPKKKYISLADQVAENGVTCTGNRWSITSSNGKRIDLEIKNTSNDETVAADWAEVAGALAT